MSRLANTDNSQYSAHFGSSTVPSCGLSGGSKRRRRTFRKRHMKKRKSLRMKRTSRRRISRRKTSRRRLKGGSYTLMPNDQIKMGPKGGLGHITKSDMTPNTNLISKSHMSPSGDINNLQGQFGGKKRRRTRRRRHRGGAPVAFGYGMDTKLNSIAEANPPPFSTYNSCQKDNYVH